MNLDFLNNIKKNINENEIVQNFIEEIGNFLEDKLGQKEEIGILEQIQKENKFSISSENEIRNKRTEILKSYANETKENGAMCFIVSKSGDNYNLFKYENNIKSTIKLPEKELPPEAEVNSVLRKNNGQYTLDEEGTKEITNRITEMANKVLEKQNEELQQYRKEGHLYMVEEDTNNRIYLVDITEKPGYSVEEVDFPKELLEKAKEGTIFEYTNGNYVFHSRENYDII